jgi:hypothetical protein
VALFLLQECDLIYENDKYSFVSARQNVRMDGPYLATLACEVFLFRIQ